MAGTGSVAMHKIQEAITKINLNRTAFENFAKLLCQATYGLWKEDLQVRKYFGIKNFDEMAGDIKKILKLPESEYKKLLFFHEYGQENDNKTLEIHYKMEDPKGFDQEDPNNYMDVRYVCFAMHKDATTNETDLIFCYFTLFTKPSMEQMEVEVKTKNWWFWRHREATLVKKPLDNTGFQNLLTNDNRDDYFRYRVVDAFVAEGLVDRRRILNYEHTSAKLARPVDYDVDPSRDALYLIQQAIYSIEYNEASSERFKKKLSELKIQSWTENVEVQKTFNIPDKDKYLKGLKGIVGLPERDYLEMKCACKYAKRGEVNKMELNYTKGNLETCYLFYAFHKHAHSGRTDMVYAHFRLKSKAVTTETVTENVGWGGIFWRKPRETKTFTLENNVDELNLDKDRDNYFRCKVLQKFVGDGLVEETKLNKVNL